VVQRGTTAEFCAGYQELQADAADYAGAATIGELIDVLDVAIEAQQGLPVPDELVEAVRDSIEGLEAAVDRFEDLDPSISLESPTAEQQEDIADVVESMDDAERAAETMREFAEDSCSGPSTTLGG